MLWIELSSVVADTWDDCWPAPLEPPNPDSEAIEYMDMRFAMVPSGELRRPERDTAENGFDQAAAAGRRPLPNAGVWSISTARLRRPNAVAVTGGRCRLLG